LDRSRIKLVQTPQTFLGGVLLDAFAAAVDGALAAIGGSAAYTDEATVVEAAGQAVRLVEGEISNIKITTPDDLVLAAEMLRMRI
jgi:2-C-methyl-D-erythritol 4-phosphate cytidylyltransferase